MAFPQHNPLKKKRKKKIYLILIQVNFSHQGKFQETFVEFNAPRTVKLNHGVFCFPKWCKISIEVKKLPRDVH